MRNFAAINRHDFATKNERFDCSAARAYRACDLCLESSVELALAHKPEDTCERRYTIGSVDCGRWTVDDVEAARSISCDEEDWFVHVGSSLIVRAFVAEAVRLRPTAAAL
jgi:hypothetical protein